MVARLVAPLDLQIDGVSRIHRVPKVLASILIELQRMSVPYSLLYAH
jgi:hypothetical protein